MGIRLTQSEWKSLLVRESEKMSLDGRRAMMSSRRSSGGRRRSRQLSLSPSVLAGRSISMVDVSR